jgi:hypothetical protein
MAKQRVLVDTCIIIEAFRVNCWKALCQHFEVETVQCCVDECAAGDPLEPGRVPIPRDELLAGLSKVHAVDELMLATLAIERADLPAIDAGELHMMAWLHANPDQAVISAISTADRAAIRATYVLKLVDRVVSLQHLAQTAGVRNKQVLSLKNHFSEDWLSDVRFQLKMGIL